MDLKPEVILPLEWIVRCKEYGEEIVAGYAAGRNAASRAVSSHGAEADADLQATAKMGEVAFCLAAGMNPEAALNWSGATDQGWDVKFFGIKVDVKTIGMHKELLIWPVNKTSFFWEKKFDVLVLVKAAPPRFVIQKWITKMAFYAEKTIAGSERRGITPGTWYLAESSLWGLDALAEFLKYR